MVLDSNVAPTKAQLYAALHRGNPGDTAFYVRECRGAQHVLELGSGYGRMAFALAEAGHAVTGLELDPGLLALSRQALAGRSDLAGRVRFVSGDMRDFDLQERFERVIIPYSGLYCLLGDDEVQACLAAARRHLVEGGKLCLDAYYADAFHADSEPGDVASDQLEPVVSFVHDEQLLSVYEKSEWNKDAQRIDVFYEYRNSLGELVHSSLLRQRYLLCEQLRERLRASGFSATSTFADFAETDPTPETDTVAMVANNGSTAESVEDLLGVGIASPTNA